MKKIINFFFVFLFVSTLFSFTASGANSLPIQKDAKFKFKKSTIDFCMLQSAVIYAQLISQGVSQSSAQYLAHYYYNDCKGLPIPD